MSELTEITLDLMELELAGLVRRVMRSDGEESWELTTLGKEWAAALAGDSDEATTD